MTKKKFTEILKEYDFSDKQIDIIWNTRPNDNLNEEVIRKASKKTAPDKDKVIQK